MKSMAIEDSFKRLDIMKDIDYFHRDTYERLARSNRFVPLTNLECWDNLLLIIFLD